MEDGIDSLDGSVQLRQLADDPAQKYYLYLPAVAKRDTPIVFCVHGISRNAAEHARCFAPVAAAYGTILVAPVFAASRFPDYQRLGRRGRGMRADLMLNRIADEVEAVAMLTSSRRLFFGHSGGGQFVHRYVMAHPAKVDKYVISAAGWYTWPEPTAPFPFGTGATPDLPDLAFDLDEFLAVYGCVFVGSRDTGRGHAVRKSERIDRDQGVTRLERGSRWSAAMNRAARVRCMPEPLTYRELPGAAHRFSGMARRGQLAEAAFAFLLGAANGQNVLCTECRHPIFRS